MFITMSKTKSKTSLEALRGQIESGRLTTNIVRVAHRIKERPDITKNEIMVHFEMTHPTATSVLSFLQDVGLIEPSGTADGCNKYIYQTDRDKQLKNAMDRKTEKFKKWVRYGRENFPDMVDELDFINPN